MSVLILSGSPIIGNFDFRQRVDFVRVPGVIKLRNGDYTSHSIDLDVEQTLAMRASIIRHTAEVFDPDIFIVDKEPLGMRGEVEATLHHLQSTGARLVLGLRDIMDEPSRLIEEWTRKEAFGAVENYYDDIWIYGLPEICDPLADIGVSVHATWVGHYCTSLEMAGASVTLFHLDDELQTMLDHPCDCAMFRAG